MTSSKDVSHATKDALMELDFIKSIIKISNLKSPTTLQTPLHFTHKGSLGWKPYLIQLSAVTSQGILWSHGASGPRQSWSPPLHSSHSWPWGSFGSNRKMLQNVLLMWVMEIDTWVFEIQTCRMLQYPFCFCSENLFSASVIPLTFRDPMMSTLSISSSFCS